MKKIVILFFGFFYGILGVYANEIEEVKNFFYKYVNSANCYNNNHFDYYSKNAKIIRVVEKPDGTNQSINIPIEKYKEEVAKSKKLMRLRNYKNHYFNVKICPFGQDYKIIAMRMPSTSDYKIPAHFIVGKNTNGEWEIKEESMNTKVQKFLENS